MSKGNPVLEVFFCFFLLLIGLFIFTVSKSIVEDYKVEATQQAIVTSFKNEIILVCVASSDELFSHLSGEEVAEAKNLCEVAFISQILKREGNWPGPQLEHNTSIATLVAREIASSWRNSGLISNSVKGDFEFQAVEVLMNNMRAQRLLLEEKGKITPSPKN